MFTSALATMTTFEVVLFGKNNIAFLRIIEITFFSGKVAI